jgi:hypothetical protein
MSNQMVERKPEWLEAIDLIITTIETVNGYGPYIKMGGHCLFGRDK